MARRKNVPARSFQESVSAGVFRFLGDSLGRCLRGFGAALRHPLILLPAVILLLVQAALSLAAPHAADVPAVQILSLLTFAQGGMYAGAPGAAGGVIGKALMAGMVTGLFAGRREPRPAGTEKTRGGSALTLLPGIGAGLIAYNFLTGNARLENAMIGVVCAIAAFRAAGRPETFAFGLIRSFSRGKTPERSVRFALLGVGFGSALGVLSSLKGGGAVCYLAGAVLLLAGLLLTPVIRKKRAAAAVLACLCSLPLLAISVQAENLLPEDISGFYDCDIFPSPDASEPEDETTFLFLVEGSRLTVYSASPEDSLDELAEDDIAFITNFDPSTASASVSLTQTDRRPALFTLPSGETIPSPFGQWVEVPQEVEGWIRFSRGDGGRVRLDVTSDTYEEGRLVKSEVMRGVRMDSESPFPGAPGIRDGGDPGSPDGSGFGETEPGIFPEGLISLPFLEEGDWFGPDWLFERRGPQEAVRTGAAALATGLAAALLSAGSALGLGVSPPGPAAPGREKSPDGRPPSAPESRTSAPDRKPDGRRSQPKPGRRKEPAPGGRGGRETVPRVREKAARVISDRQAGQIRRMTRKYLGYESTDEKDVRKVRSIIRKNQQDAARVSVAMGKIDDILEKTVFGLELTESLSDALIDVAGDHLGAMGKGVRAGYKVLKETAKNCAEKGVSMRTLAEGALRGGGDAASDFYSFRIKGVSGRKLKTLKKYTGKKWAKVARKAAAKFAKKTLAQGIGEVSSSLISRDVAVGDALYNTAVKSIIGSGKDVLNKTRLISSNVVANRLIKETGTSLDSSRLTSMFTV